MSLEIKTLIPLVKSALIAAPKTSSDLELQTSIANKLSTVYSDVQRRHKLHPTVLLDLFLGSVGIAIEVNLEDPKELLYKRCLRYSKQKDIQCIILISHKAIAFPRLLNNKPCHVLKPSI